MPAPNSAAWLSTVVDGPSQTPPLWNAASPGTLASPVGRCGSTVSPPGPTRTPAWTGPDGFGAGQAAASGKSLDEFLEGFPTAAGLPGNGPAHRAGGGRRGVVRGPASGRIAP